MSLERIAVATAVISAAVSAGSLLLAWYRGSARHRPRLAGTLVGLTLASAAGLIVALAFAGSATDVETAPSARALNAGEYRTNLIAICEQHREEAQRIERAEGNRPVFASAVLLETKTTDRIKVLRPPPSLRAAHRSIVTLWGRRLSLLRHYWERFRREVENAGFRQEFARAIKRIDALTQRLQERFVALGVTPECSVFV